MTSDADKEQLRLIQSDLRALEELTSSRGWRLVLEVLQNDATLALEQFSSKVVMDIDEMHWRRGALHANRELQKVPGALIKRLQTDILFLSAQVDETSTSSAKADE